MDFHNLGRLNKAGKKKKVLKERFCYLLKHHISKQIGECEEINLSSQLFREFRFVSILHILQTGSLQKHQGEHHKQVICALVLWLGRKAPLSISVRWCSLLFKYSTGTRSDTSFDENRICQNKF